MKKAVLSRLSLLGLLLSITLMVKAQDALPVLEPQDPMHREFNLDEDKTLIYDHPTHSNNRDTVQLIVPATVPVRTTPAAIARPAKPDNHKGKAKDKDEEDALSFNFLYYMLQKFKMSDLVDQHE
mgnify:CR=1 FL=1